MKLLSELMARYISASEGGLNATELKIGQAAQPTLKWAPSISDMKNETGTTCRYYLIIIPNKTIRASMGVWPRNYSLRYMQNSVVYVALLMGRGCVVH